MSEEILPIFRPKRPTRIKFNKKGRIVDLILIEMRMMRKLRKMSGLSKEFFIDEQK